MPLLLTVYDLPAREAVTTSIFIQCFGQASAMIANSWRGLVDWKLVTIQVMSGIPGAVAGVFLFNLITPPYIQLILGIIIFVVAYVFLAGDSFFEEGGKKADTKAAFKALPITLTGGILTGLLGIGTGDWLVPYFNKKCGLNMSVSVATGIALMFILSITTLTFHFITDSNVNWHIAFPSVTGVVIGAQAGAWLLSRTSDVRFKEIFVLLLVFLAAHVTFNSLP